MAVFVWLLHNTVLLAKQKKVTRLKAKNKLQLDYEMERHCRRLLS